MKTREEIITGMCYTFRHDYGLDKSCDGHTMLSGMTNEQRMVLWMQMSQIFEHDIRPLLAEAGVHI